MTVERSVGCIACLLGPKNFAVGRVAHLSIFLFSQHEQRNTDVREAMQQDGFATVSLQWARSLKEWLVFGVLMIVFGQRRQYSTLTDVFE